MPAHPCVQSNRRAELAGEEGDVDASTQMIGEASQVKAARDAYEAQHKPKARRDYVCPVSGVIYSSGDVVRSHLLF